VTPSAEAPSGDLTPIEAVTFDYWDTLVAVADGGASRMRAMQIERFAATLASADRSVDLDDLSRAFDENWGRFVERWHANTGQLTPADSVAWLCERLGLDVTTDLVERLVAGFDEVGRRSTLVTGPGLGRALDLLEDAGVGLAIVCDVGLTPSPVLRERLDDLGLLGRFRAWSFSDETGWFKPAAEAFRPALDALGVEPGRAAHVGDNARTDVAGARALGMTSIRFTGLVDWPPAEGLEEADVVLADLAALPAAVGIAAG
jgi:putative hydrolase of the HAD superfamily